MHPNLDRLQVPELERLYLQKAETLKRKLRRGVHWDRLLELRNTLTTLALTIHLRHTPSSCTEEQVLFGEKHC
jgi:hypothetical protein